MCMWFVAQTHELGRPDRSHWKPDPRIQMPTHHPKMNSELGAMLSSSCGNRNRTMRGKGKFTIQLSWLMKLWGCLCWRRRGTKSVTPCCFCSVTESTKKCFAACNWVGSASSFFFFKYSYFALLLAVQLIKHKSEQAPNNWPLDSLSDRSRKSVKRGRNSSKSERTNFKGTKYII